MKKVHRDSAIGGSSLPSLQAASGPWKAGSTRLTGAQLPNQHLLLTLLICVHVITISRGFQK